MTAILRFCARFRVVLVLLLVGYAGMRIARTVAKDRVSGDFRSILVAAERLKVGDPVYFPQRSPEDEMPNKHGLVFLELLRPLTSVPPLVAQGIWLALSVLLLIHTLFVLSRMLAGRDGVPETEEDRVVSVGAPVLALVLIAPFAHLLVSYAQTGFFLLWLLVLGVRACQRRRELAGGALFGLAIAVKLFPVVLLPWALWTGRARAVFGMVIGLVAAFALSAGLHGPTAVKAHVQDYVSMLQEDAAGDSQHPFHQSLRPLVLGTIATRYDVGLASQEDREEAKAYEGVRNFAADAWMWERREFVVGIATLLFVLACAWAIPPFFSKRRRTTVLAEVGLVLATMVLVSPLAWKHYYVWAMPMLAWLAAQPSRWAGCGLLVWLALLTLPHKGVLGRSLAGEYAVFHGYALGLALFCLVAAVAVRCSRTSASRAAES